MADLDDSLEVFEGQINTDNPEPRCACLLLLDTSSSMSGEPIRQLNEGIASFADELQEDPLARKRTEVEVITFGGVPEVVSHFCEVGAFHPPTLEPAGNTPMAAGILLALSELAERKRVYREIGVEFYRPWLIMMTDGQPTDDDATVTDALASLQKWEEKRHASVFPVGVGPHADMEFLKRAALDRAPLHLRETDLKSFFEWASVNLASVSASGGHGSSEDEVNRKIASGEQVPLTPPPKGWDFA